MGDGGVFEFQGDFAPLLVDMLVAMGYKSTKQVGGGGGSKKKGGAAKKA